MKSLGKFPDAFAAEIAGQPGALRRAAAALGEQRPALDRLADVASGSATVAFTGMGSSYDACYPAVNELASRGLLVAHADAAELLHFRAGMLGADSLVLVVSQSGLSAETTRLVTTLRERERPPTIVSITNGLGNPLADAADLRLDTRAGREDGPSTMTFAASLVAVAATGLVVGRVPVAEVLARLGNAAEAAAREAERLLEDADALSSTVAEAIGARGIVAILGRGPARAAAEMGALTLKESGVMAESFEGAAFRHGPFELAGPSLAAIVLATEPETRGLDLAMAADLVDAGASVITIGAEPTRSSVAVALGELDRLVASAVSIVPIQLGARRLSLALGREPGVYLRAAKVTTRE